MVSWSTLRPLLTGATAKSFQNAVAKRAMSGGHEHRVLPYQPSKWQWNKFKDLIHFYVMLGLIPIGAIVTYTNVFIGPATLTETPEGYEPKHWEYYRLGSPRINLILESLILHNSWNLTYTHPISRFIAKYMLNSPQQDYEKYLHHIFEEEEKRRIRMLEEEVKNKMAERNDYQAYYYRPVTAKYHRQAKATAEYLDSLRGD